MHKLLTVIFILVMSVALFAADKDKSDFIKQLEKGKPQTIVCYGTSLTAGDDGWVSLLEQYLQKYYGENVNVINSAVGGMWSGWGVENLDEKVIANKPDAVIIEFAVNDSHKGYKTSKEDSRNNLNQMINRIKKANPKCEVIVMVTNPIVGYHAEGREEVVAYFDGYRAVAKERKLKLIDTYDIWSSIYKADPRVFSALMPDGIHPNTSGSRLVTLPVVISVLCGYDRF